MERSAVQANSVRVRQDRRDLSIGSGKVPECTHGPVDEIHTSHEFGWFCRTVMPDGCLARDHDFISNFVGIGGDHFG